MSREAILLVGGQGSRLKSVVQDIPKPMALVAGRPFLEYIMDHLNRYGICKVILAVGYKRDLVIDHFGHKYLDMDVAYSIEESPLGTGGAIHHALDMCKSDDILICNGDSIITEDLDAFYSFHKQKKADLSIILKKKTNFDRYGRVDVQKEKIKGFKEKSFCANGLINSGVYLLRRNTGKDTLVEGKSSFEKDFLEIYTDDLRFYGFVSDAYFIDIGIPEDYGRANTDFTKDKSGR